MKKNDDQSLKIKDQIRLVDGGVFDNSGLVTLFDIVFKEINSTKRSEQEILILFIDSGNDLQYPEINGGACQYSYHNEFCSFNFPIKGINGSLDTALLVHHLNKRRTISLAILKAAKDLVEINKTRPNIHIKIIPIMLTAVNIRDHENIVNILDDKRQGIQNIATYFSISNKDIEKLEDAAKIVLEKTYQKTIMHFKDKYSIDVSEANELFYDNGSLNTIFKNDQIKLKDMIGVVAKRNGKTDLFTKNQ